VLERLEKLAFRTGKADTTAYRAALRGYFRKRAAAADVEDLVQEVFLRLQSRRAESEIQDLERYLFVVARHVLASRRSAPVQEGTDSLLNALHDEVSPERVMLGRERLDRALTVIASLTPRTRQVFLLHRFEEMTYQSIARRLGISVSAVEKHIMIALRALLQDVGGSS
jgi:RNA polymerase sigma factor (sigma-70 family)